MDELLRKVEEEYMRTDLPDVRPGDTVRVHWRLVEEKHNTKKAIIEFKTRVQVFEGVVLSVHGKGLNKRILVRKVSNGVPVERVFPLHSPYLEKLEVVSRARVRKAKLYYLRHKVGKAAKLKVLREKR